MKEATGELSVTVITIVAIGLVIAIFTAFLLPTLKIQIALTQACNNGPGYNIEMENYTINCGGGEDYICTYKEGTGGKVQTKSCTGADVTPSK